MRDASIPNQNQPKGLIARLAIQCPCPDTGVKGSFLFSGESYQNRQSRVTPVYNGLAELFAKAQEKWEEIIPGNAAYGFMRR